MCMRRYKFYVRCSWCPYYGYSLFLNVYRQLTLISATLWRKNKGVPRRIERATENSITPLSEKQEGKRRKSLDSETVEWSMRKEVSPNWTEKRKNRGRKDLNETEVWKKRNRADRKKQYINADTAYSMSRKDHALAAFSGLIFGSFLCIKAKLWRYFAPHDCQAHGDPRLGHDMGLGWQFAKNGFIYW